MSTVYVASSLHNKERTSEIVSKLKQLGLTITYDWTQHGFIDDEHDRAAAAYDEINGVSEADVLLIVWPGRNGTHFEWGVAYGSGKPVVVLLEDNNDNSYGMTSFHHMHWPIFKDIDSAIKKVFELATGGLKADS